ncbi:MAG: glycosyltransferase family 2 protein [Verrucomicrobia bacterium]|nr:glycosyltransferase family 2 protein [Verrucomicrobiota bacterium]MBV9644681.1 glycosyltransferase family 2 protein [Verrucomicrobiota bacterium]
MLKTVFTEEGESANVRYRYVIITPARNEATLIEQTIKSVVGQTVRPLKWVIVSDGSTDGTDDIVLRYTREHDWIELVQLPERKERNFAGKAQAFNLGYARVKGLEYDIIGNLDADLSFDEEYFEFLMEKFAADPRLGVGGTAYLDGDRTYDYRFTSTEHVSGACQMFRRECLECIGGYVPMKSGGIDLVAVVTARMKGWRTRTFLEKASTHHRKMGTASHGLLAIAFKGGYHDYLMGVHPVWQFFRSIYQLRNKPIIIGGFLLLVGYVWAWITRAERPVSKELIKFRQKEQISRLKEFFFKIISRRQDRTLI